MSIDFKFLFFLISILLGLASCTGRFGGGGSPKNMFIDLGKAKEAGGRFSSYGRLHHRYLSSLRNRRRNYSGADVDDDDEDDDDESRQQSKKKSARHNDVWYLARILSRGSAFDKIDFDLIAQRTGKFSGAGSVSEAQ